jgi:hypothetical protein
VVIAALPVAWFNDNTSSGLLCHTAGMGTCQMSNAVQVEENGPVTAEGPQPEASETDPGYHVVPYAERTDGVDLFAYRAAMAPLEPEPAVEKQETLNTKALSTIVAAGVFVGLVLLVVLLAPIVLRPKPPARYIDMGTRRLDSAGLSGRLIVRWEESAAYQLYLDPLDEQQTAEFQAMAQDPPHPLSVIIRLRDPSGVVACQKEIVFPDPAAQAGPQDRAQALMPRQTTSGDTVQNVAGADGEIAEVTVSGGLPCSLKAYQHLAGWDFSSNFPTLSGQEDWLRHEDDLAAGRSRRSAGAQGFAPRVQHLPVPVEGDDVIVGDNPSRGTVDTGGGRVFWVGASGLRNRAPEWQTFPAAIHFRCDKNGACVLTRANSRTVLQARLTR